MTIQKRSGTPKADIRMETGQCSGVQIAHGRRQHEDVPRTLERAQDQATPRSDD
jgi:hypothetical protein